MECERPGSIWPPPSLLQRGAVNGRVQGAGQGLQRQQRARSPGTQPGGRQTPQRDPSCCGGGRGVGTHRVPPARRRQKDPGLDADTRALEPHGLAGLPGTSPSVSHGVPVPGRHACPHLPTLPWPLGPWLPWCSSQGPKHTTLTVATCALRGGASSSAMVWSPDATLQWARSHSWDTRLRPGPGRGNALGQRGTQEPAPGPGSP